MARAKAVKPEPTEEEKTPLVEDTSKEPDNKQVAELEEIVADETAELEDDQSKDQEEVSKKVPLSERLGELDDIELEELFKHEKVAGRVNQLVKTQAHAIRSAEEEATRQEQLADARRKEDERLRRLRKTDIKAFNDEMDAREAAEEFQKREQARNQAIAASFTEKLDDYVKSNFPASVYDKLASADYSNVDFITGVVKYIDGLVSEHRVQTRKDIEKELRPVIRKQLLTEQNGGESPEPANGGRGKTKVSQDYQTENEAAKAFADGDIDLETLRALYASHHWRR